MTKWKVLSIEPNKEPYEAELSFKEMQQFVEGYVERIPLYDDFIILANEEGMLKNLQPNREIVLFEKSPLPILIVGNFVVTKEKEGELVDLTYEEINELKQIFRV